MGALEQIPPSDGALSPGATASAKSIEVENLVIHYGKTAAVGPISFSVKPGELLTLLGPSGCGKTTLLRAIAGLETPSEGEIRIGGKVVYSRAKRINVATEKRELSMVFQSYAIWPHMSVFANVAYPLRARKVGAKEVTEKVNWALNLVRLGEYGDRPASRLSGGQQQRCALARAVVFSPRVLLLDEPLSNLDARLRQEMRVEIKELQRRLGITAVYVTHDQEEALATSDRVTVMNAGHIEQMGDPLEVYNAPRNAFVASFIGSANLVRSPVATAPARPGLVALQTPAGNPIYAEDNGRLQGGAGALAIRAVYPQLSRARPAREFNCWPAKIARRVYLGDFIEYFVDWEGTRLIVRTLPTDRFEEGEQVYVAIDPRYCVLLE